MKTLFTVLSCFFLMSCTGITTKKEVKIQSPDNSIIVTVKLNENQSPCYIVEKGGLLVLENSLLGIVRRDADFSKGLKIATVGDVAVISESYETLTGKKKICSYSANSRVISFINASGEKIEIIFRVSNDGVAFRYNFPGTSVEKKYITEEATTFNFPAEAKAWLHPHTNAQTGWCNVEPCYEMHYYQDIAVSTPAPFKAGWSFPALFQSNGVWVLLTESGLEPTYCGTRLAQASPDGEYSIEFPQDAERTSSTAALHPESALPWKTPWRIIALGSLKQIVENTLVTDLAVPSLVENTGFVKPGRASWSWALLKDNSVVFDVQKRFVDLAAKMGWEYCLVDVEWDKRIGYEKIQELIDYADGKNVGIILWYNSSGAWNTTTYSPKDMMYEKDIRRKEFEKISNMGVKGIKVDFWGGDGQSMIQYYYDLFEDAAEFGLLVNCHGATVPRGWDRTFPNLVSMESVKGFEYITFEQRNADSAATHCSMLPFTRNVVGSMDFTPVCFSEIPGIQKRTSDAFELALSVMFQSGVQHYAEIPEGMDAQPDDVVEFLRKIPPYWDDISFIDGYPGKYVVLARKYGKKWFVAGINSEKTSRKLQLDLSSLNANSSGVLITDDESGKGFTSSVIKMQDNQIGLVLKPTGGFVLYFE
ncbi:MAG: glycoside hydrolase family 97 catalytic domain-containing protein [Bacteroidales bacterium]|nr:glycoside hydrolase family 97 catalytic domain-containing protein [Bacteroidales bacterium]